FGTFSSSQLQFLPRLEDAFDLYTKMLIGMIAVFQMPTITFFLAKMRVITARFLARHIKYAVLIIFIVAAVLTPSSDPWNQIIFAVPMIGLYLRGLSSPGCRSVRSSIDRPPYKTVRDVDFRVQAWNTTESRRTRRFLEESAQKLKDCRGL